MTTRHPLAERFRQLAATLREGGASQAAEVWDLAANRVEAYERERALEALSLTEAAVESGYSADHLGALIGAGRLPNAGHKHSPRIRRQDLPRKPGHGVKPHPRTPTGDPDLVARVLSPHTQGER